MARIIARMMGLYTFDGQHAAAFAQFRDEHINFRGHRLPIERPEHIQRQIAVGNGARQCDVLVHLGRLISQGEWHNFRRHCGPIIRITLVFI